MSFLSLLVMESHALHGDGGANGGNIVLCPEDLREIYLQYREHQASGGSVPFDGKTEETREANRVRGCKKKKLVILKRTVEALGCKLISGHVKRHIWG